MNAVNLADRARRTARRLDNGLRRRWDRWAFDCAVGNSLPRLGPLQVVPAPLRIVSMVSSRHRLMYEVAIRALYRQLGRGSVTVLDDGSLTPRDREELFSRLPGVEIVPISSIDTGPCPRGGTWERLLHIVDLSRDAYVIQLDSDTITSGPMPEIEKAIGENCAFTIGTRQSAGIVSLAEASAVAERDPGGHIQDAAERHLAALPMASELRYVRGCSAFAGFPKGTLDRAHVYRLSEALEARLGRRWHEWGTEQVTSNLVIASQPDARVLQVPRYVNFDPAHGIDAAAFVHFMGTHRFAGGVYRRSALDMLAELQADRRASVE